MEKEKGRDWEITGKWLVSTWRLLAVITEIFNIFKLSIFCIYISVNTIDYILLL